MGVRVGEALHPGPEPAEADKERAEIIGKLRKYSCIGKLSMDQMRRVFLAAHLAGLSFADDLGQLKTTLVVSLLGQKMRSLPWIRKRHLLKMGPY